MSDATPEPDEVKAKLSQNAYSANFVSLGIIRADGACLPANSPCEDRFNRTQTFFAGGTEWVACSVFDGHNGWQTAAYLEEVLLKQLQARLEELKPENRSEAALQDVIKDTFVQLDNAICDSFRATANDKQTPWSKRVGRMQRAMAGSCALVSLYDPFNATIYTACTGDSRAVLGQQNMDGTWDAIPLSVDQGPGNEIEQERIKAEHPGEADMFTEVNGHWRFMDFGVTRAFGDFPHKCAYEEVADLSKRAGAAWDVNKETTHLTPPYIIAEPVVTVRKLEQRPSFLVLVSDGVWEGCEDYEVLGLVVLWLEAQPDAAKNMVISPEDAWFKGLVEPKWEPGFDYLGRWEEDITNRFDVRFTTDKVVLEDLDNVAVHLLRNACGGNHRELLEGKLAFDAPFARNIRDDMTVQVLFFDLDWPQEIKSQLPKEEPSKDEQPKDEPSEKDNAAEQPLKDEVPKDGVDNLPKEELPKDDE